MSQNHKKKQRTMVLKINKYHLCRGMMGGLCCCQSVWKWHSFLALLLIGISHSAEMGHFSLLRGHSSSFGETFQHK